MERPDTCPFPQNHTATAPLLTIGVPANANPEEKRFPLTPEAVSALTKKGIKVKIEAGAATSIHYSDIAYAQHGAQICSRNEALSCETVVHIGMLEMRDIKCLHPGALWLTYGSQAWDERNTAQIEMLTARRILILDLGLIKVNNHAPFTHSQDQTAGCAAIASAISLMKNSAHGKGILLGGITGVPPCEILIIGSNVTAVSAATAALGQGAVVRMFDNDVQSLCQARVSLPQGTVIMSTLNPHVLHNALKSADVVIGTDVQEPIINTAEKAMLKRGVIVYDLSEIPGHLFPALEKVEEKDFTGCQSVVNVLGHVARTATMAFSNSLLPLLIKIARMEGGICAQLRLDPSLRNAIITYMGQVVNPGLCHRLGIQGLDISIYFALS